MSILPTLAVVFHTLRHALVARLGRTWRSAADRERPLRVGVDIRPFYEPLTGVGWYLYYLLHELAKRGDVELYLFGDARVDARGPRLHADLPQNATYCTFDLRGLPESRLARPLTAAAYVAWIALTDCDVFFGANYFLPRLHGAVAKRRVITIHDLTYKRFPELLQKETLESLERHVSREIAIADAIVCVSESTRRDLLRYYEIDPHKAFAIHSGLGTPPAAEPVEGLPPRYLLFVSTIEPRKDLGTLIDAFQKLDDYPGSLVVVGKIGWKSEHLLPRLVGDKRVVHLDYLKASQLATVYKNAEAFIFPSLYEGFGFPLLEAMTHGVPTVAARSSSLPEIGGDATLWFEPRDADGLAEQLRRLLSDEVLRNELIDRGRRRAEAFRWETAAAKTLEVFKIAAG